MAIMFLIFLLQFINSFEGLTGAEHGTLCTSKACFTLHMDRVSFDVARKNCVHNGGYLMTVRDREEEDVLHSVLSQIQRQRQDRPLKLWIGLKLHKGNCVLSDKTLRGFEWVSGEEDSHYSNWEKEPTGTCTEERCVRVRYNSSAQNQVKWTARSCKVPEFYACKFYFKGMCKPLALLGPGKITYTAPFSEKPQRSEMKLFPLGTYADILCSDQQSHYSVCMGVDDMFHWNVPGPFCKIVKQNCTVSNGGCEHLCHQDTDQVQCLCKEGYDLDEDGLSCRMKNLCGADTCEHECVMGKSGYFCKCSQGFKLDENQHSCSEIDECQLHVCEDHLCINTHNSYTCVCKDGYEMVDDKCSDVDECTQSRCEHACLNSVGSYSCSCNEGFSLSQDGHLCTDINECVSNRCQFTCVNTVGSFLCTCPQGFYLKTDGLNCAPDVTETSAASSDDSPDEETQDNVTESLVRTTVELQHQSPHIDAPRPGLAMLRQNRWVSVQNKAQKHMPDTRIIRSKVFPKLDRLFRCPM
uniref:C-type lectin domain-containing protein n=1 Tax=Monopterus albus TaxID=43700 RepID=A0A3Q3QLC6_MONAL